MKTLCLTLLLLSPMAHSSISTDMKKTAESLSKLLLLSAQPKEFETQSSEVISLFEDLNKLLAGNTKHFKGRSPHYEMNQKILQRLNLQAFRAYKLKRYEVSRQHLLAEPNVCLSCHQNDKIKSAAFSKDIPQSLSVLEKAHLAMATRQPDMALSFLDEAMKKDLKPQELEDALRKKLQVLISEKNYSETKAELEALLTLHSKKSKDSPAARLLSGWLKGLERAQLSFSHSLTSLDQVKRAIKNTFGSEEPTFGLIANPEDEVFFLVLKKNLLNLMVDLKNKELPEAYFWMALSERAVGYDLYFSLADSFLVTCIENWPKLAIAKKCFKEYESFMEFAYSGSSGTHIPQDVKAELEGLRRKITP